MECLTQRQVPKTRCLYLSKCETLNSWLWSRWQVLWLSTKMMLVTNRHMVARPEYGGHSCTFPFKILETCLYNQSPGAGEKVQGQNGHSFNKY